VSTQTLEVLIHRDVDGKFPTPLDGALFMASLGIPQIPLRPRSKQPFMSDFPKLATTDQNQIRKWAVEHPGCNFGSVGREGEHFVFEADSVDVRKRFESTGNKFTSKLVVASRKDLSRGHRWYRSASDVENIQQGSTKYGDFSVRAKNMQCVSPGSIHPTTGEQYRLIESGVPESPSGAEIAFWKSERVEKVNGKTETPRNERGKVARGNIHTFMLGQAGRLRRAGLNQDEIETALLRIVHEQCEGPIDDEKVRKMSKSICSFPPGEDTPLVLNQKPEPKTLEPVKFRRRDYPKFPEWVLKDTSIYEGFVKPYCESNERIPYFMWAPAAAMVLNYVGNKVSVPYKSWKPSIYLALIGEKTRGHKSSSVKDAMKFLEYAGVLNTYSQSIKNADGKSIVWEAGSPEGLGTDMHRIQCKNSVLFYDEFSALVQKAGIENSGMKSSLLKMYESANFSNSIKAKKDAFHIEPDSYTASMIVCDTLEEFPAHWATFSNGAKGMDVRFSLFLQPEEMPEPKLQSAVNFTEAALKTRKLIDRAVNQGTFKFFDQAPLQAMLKDYDGRVEIRAEKWSLLFAIELGLSEIDEDCVDRGIAVAKYEHEVGKYLMMMEASSKLAVIQQNIIRTLQQAPNGSGQLPLNGKRGLNATVGAHKYDTVEWNKALFGLANNGNIVLEGSGATADPRMVRLIRGFDFDLEEE
jgi:bifunctional DNA primase/polymerase-like protein